MIEIEPKGYKFIVSRKRGGIAPRTSSHAQVTSTFSENLGQAGRADLSCHWEDADCAIQEMYSNVSAGI